MHDNGWALRELEVAIAAGRPVPLIREHVKQYQLNLQEWAHLEHGLNLAPFRWASKFAPSEWKCEFVAWLLDECGYPLNETYSRLYQKETVTHFFLLDYLIWQPGLGCAKVFSMVRHRGGQFTCGLRSLLEFVDSVVEWRGSGRRDYLERCEFLLDCGAIPFSHTSSKRLLDMYDTHCRARRRAIAVLSLKRMRPDLRGMVPRELWERMARYLWSLRFYVK